MIWAGARRRSLGNVVLVALTVAAAIASGLALSSGASAHHPDISGSARCGTSGPVLSWTARSWLTYDDPHAYNYDIDVDVRIGNGSWQNIGHGAFDEQDDFQFSGTYDLPSSVPSVLSLRSIARGPFGPNGQFGAVGESRTTDVEVPRNCNLPTGTECGGTLGKAADYNLYVRTDATLRGSDIDGRAAVGGHLDAANFGVGRALTPDSSRVDLAVGGTIGASAVTVHNGSVTNGSGTVSGVSTPLGLITTANGAWIANEFTPLTAAAQTWASTAAQGTVVLPTPGDPTMQLIGTDAKTNVFAVTAASLTTARTVRVQVPAGSTVLVNVSGQSFSAAIAPLSAMQFWDGTRYTQFAYPSNDPVAVGYRTQLLWNFFQATSVELGGLSWEGSVLAPYAAVSLTGGQLNGALIADSIAAGNGGSTTELHPYRAAVSCLPPPPGQSSGGDGSGGGGGGGDTPTGTTTPPPPIDVYCGTYGTLAGSVFEDHNANGSRDGGGTAAAADRGLAGVTVTATDETGSVVGTATSGADGTWSMDIVRARSKYLEVRFTTLPAGYQPGARTTSGSTTQFVRLCNTKVDLALQIPSHYCQDNPDLAASCSFRASNASLAVRTQSWASGWNAASSSFAPTTDAEYGTGHPDGDGGDTGNPVAVTMSQIGAVNGLAWRPASRSLYAAAFVKAASPLGPGGVGAVYRIPVAADGTGGAPIVAATLPASATGSPTITSSGVPANVEDAGRTGLGDVVLVPGAHAEDDTLYVVGLADRKLYALNELDQAPSVSSTTIDLPLGLPGAGSVCARADVRPGAVTQYGDSVYVGLTCTAESTGDRTQLAAYVYRYRPGVGFDTTPALELPLTYDRTEIESWTTADGNWVPWSNDLDVHHNQAWLTGLAVTEGVGTEPGALVLALRSRAGDTDDANGNLLAEGDLLFAPRTGDHWTIESDLSPTTQSEYFAQESFPWTGAVTHYEATRGSVAAIPGYRNVAVQQLTNWYASGLTWQNVGTARIERAMSMYSADSSSPRFQGDTFSKANGLGDLVALCDQAPIQIGDRVWSDVNGDGIQQPGELGLKGVRVELQQDGVTLATSVTNGVGIYSFPNLQPNTPYEVVIDVAQTTVGTTVISPDRRGDDREIDADAVSRTVGGRTLAVIAVVTGPAGSNDFGYDFGFVRANGTEDPCATSCDVESEVVSPPTSGPDPTWFNP